MLDGTFPRFAAITPEMCDATHEVPGHAVDADLMRRTAAGDLDAFATLYRRHHAIVFRFARLMTGSQSAAEDIVQEVFLVVMRNANRYDPSRAALPTYLYGIARHQIRRRLTRDRKFVALDGIVPEAPAIEPNGDPTTTLERREDLLKLRRAILSLPRKYREVIVLCDLQDVSYCQSAAALGCAVGTIRSRLHRARHLLTQKMGRAATNTRDHDEMTMRCAV